MSYYFLCNVFYCCDMPAEHLQDEECTLFLHAQHFNEALNFGHYVLSRNSLGNNAKQYTNKCWNSTYSGNNLYWSLMASLPPSNEIYEKLIECHIMSPANVKVMMMILAWQWPIIPSHSHTAAHLPTCTLPLMLICIHQKKTAMIRDVKGMRDDAIQSVCVQAAGMVSIWTK